MQIYKLSKNLLTEIREQKFDYENELQGIVESNLQALFELDLVASELRIGGYKFDSLAHNAKTESFVIIEYKNKKNSGLVDQGYAYLATALQYQAMCVLAYNEKYKSNLKIDRVKWEALKVIFISPSFNQYQKDSVNFKDMPFELWTLKYFDKDLIALTQHHPSSKKSVVPYSPRMKEVSEKIKQPDIDDLVNQMTPKCKKIWQNLHEMLSLAYPDAEFRSATNYISLRKDKIVCYLNLRKDGFSAVITRGFKDSNDEWLGDSFTLDDPKGVTRTTESKAGPGRLECYYRWDIKTTEDLGYTEYLIRQKYNSM